MFRGYLHEEERYRKCFAGGWYLTGDLARRDADGYFWFVGRADDVIKTAGHLIGPFEVESVLMEHPAVAEAGVIGKPDPVAGELVKAFVIAAAAGYAAERRAAARAPRPRPRAPGRGGGAEGDRLPRRAAAHAQRQDHAPAAQGARARAAGGRHLDAGGRLMSAHRAARARARDARCCARCCCIRRFEERCVELYSAAKIRGFLHLYIGEEAVAVGAMQALEPDDAVVATYREHGHALVRGVSAGAVMAEMFGKAEGCSRGRGGSMHLFDAATRFYGGNAIVGGGLPLAVGLALADKHATAARVTACFFGEGAVAEGEFHESMNLAALWRLPVLFLLREQPLRDGHGARALRVRDRPRAARPRATGCRPGPSTAWTCWRSRTAARRAALAVRGGGGPCFLELRTYRFRAHSMYDPELYRTKEEIERWKAARPDRRARRARCAPTGCSTTATSTAIEARGRRRDRRRRRLRRGRHARAGRGLLRYVYAEAGA